MLLYMALAPEAKLTYEKGGPAAEARFEAGVAGFEARAFRGCGIMTSEPFEVSDDQDSVQMLTRNSQIGEFYVLQPPQVPPEEGKEKFTCDILIYDEESDRHVRITWGQALAACCIGMNNGAGAVVTNMVDGTKNMSHPTPGMNNDKSLGAWYLKAKAIQEYNEQATKKAYSTVDPDIRIVVARPFIEHLMHSVVMAVSGRDTVRAPSSNAMSQPALTDHASLAHVTGSHALRPGGHAIERQHPSQEWARSTFESLNPNRAPTPCAHPRLRACAAIEGHYTGHFKAVVTKPQNVLVRANHKTLLLPTITHQEMPPSSDHVPCRHVAGHA